MQMFCFTGYRALLLLIVYWATIEMFSSISSTQIVPSAHQGLVHSGVDFKQHKYVFLYPMFYSFKNGDPDVVVGAACLARQS